MKIIDLSKEHEQLFFCCLEDWSDDARKEGAPRREEWYERSREKGIRAKLAEDENGNIGGMIQYAPIEQTYIEGSDLYFIYCIWVHGHKQGRGNFQKKGMGQALLAAAEEDARQLGAKGIAAWGILLPFWMKASWFRKHGYKSVSRDGIAQLVWKQFTDDALPPRWNRQRKKPELNPGKVTVTSFVNGWCMAQNITHERARRAAAEFGDRVIFQEFNTFDRDVLQEWGIVDALFIDGKQVNTGPPPSYEKIMKKITKRVSRL